MWFDDIAEVDNPGREELRLFVRDVRHFLFYVLVDKRNFGFLWEQNPILFDLAMETMRFDIAEGAGLELDRAIDEISNYQIRSHGLEGRPLRFKFQVLNTIANQWDSIGDALSVREWFKKIIDAIDAILDSLIDAADGAGGIIKEFKETLSSLA
jgi:hypothetical protein